ncbi:MAG: tape measure protein, partial [Burkholderiales bacterium]|nr:tape measure protein [Burkholderiales bacterium]
MSVDIQTIGVGFETAGLVKGQQALDATAAAAARTADAADRVGATASRAMESAGRSAETASRQMGGAFTTVRNVLTSMGGSGGVLAAFMGGAVGAGLIEVARSAVNAAGAMVTMADAASNMRQQLNLASGSAREAQDAYDRLLSIAQRSRVEVTALAGTYAQMARSTSDLGIGQDRVLRVTETLSKAITMSGGSAQSAQAAMVQLSQGLSAGALRGEELNSILEQTPRVARALSDGLGVGIGQLRAMGEAGELTAERVIQAFEKSAGAIDREFAKTEATVSQSMTVLSNAMLDFVGQVDQASGASASAARGIMSIAAAVESVTGALNALQSNPLASVLFPKGGTLGAALPAPLQMIDRLAGGLIGTATTGSQNKFDSWLKDHEDSVAKWSDEVVASYNKAQSAVEKFANDKNNLSRLDQKVAEQR